MRFSAKLIGMLVLAQTFSAAFGAWEQPVIIEEVLGHSWPMASLHQRIEIPAKDKVRPDGIALFLGNERVPDQLANLETDAAGNLRAADVWFQTDLPANSKKMFVLKDFGGSAVEHDAKPTDLSVVVSGNVCEIRNGLTTVRLPAGRWTAPSNAAPAQVCAALAAQLGAKSTTALPGPLLGIQLPSGQWTAGSSLDAACSFAFDLQPGIIQPEIVVPIGAFEGYETELLAQGPLFAKARVTYRFSGGGLYAVDFTVRVGEPMVRIDEHYERAGTVTFDCGTAFQPTGAVSVANRSIPAGRSISLASASERTSALFTGWNYFFDNVSAVFALTGAPSGDLLGLVSTDPDWLPFPYNQALHLVTAPNAPLRLQASLNHGHRHWGLLTGKAADFPTPAVDMYRWWQSRVALPLDKVANWRLTWPNMDTIDFPHTFFGKAELPGIRASLQADPIITECIAGLKGATIPEVAAAFLVTGDTRFTDRMTTNQNLNPLLYLDRIVDTFLNQNGFFSAREINPMQMTDELFQRLIAMDFVLGNDRLPTEQRHAALVKLAFAVNLMHDWQWIPPNYDFSPQKDESYLGYVQGTPNQKQCYLSVRAMTACLLTGHPALPAWINIALEENDRITAGAVAPSGAHVESPFYSARDTMRFGPFWKALLRAGVDRQRADPWIEREKHCYEYMADMLTPPEPRVSGRRVYQPIGRSSTGVIDPTLMIGADPFGIDDEAHCRLMRWCWEAQGKPSPTTMGTTGGRDLAQTILAFSQVLRFPANAQPPLASRRWEGMGAVFRSQVGTSFESSVLFRHDPFCWNLYPANNGAVYFYGKGAPLSARFGAYWTPTHLMSVPFGNRVIFGAPAREDDWTDALGTMTDCALLGDLADYASGITRSNDWRRSVLFAKDASKDDPVYLLVRDDVYRADPPPALHWWIMSKAVQPDGFEKPGVVPPKGADEQWLTKLGHNWSNAPTLQGQLQHFEGQFGVDLDLFIAVPTEPHIVSDAVGVGPKLAYCDNPKLYEYQQLVRIEQTPGQGFLTLLAPRWPNAPVPEYRTIANGSGVKVKSKTGEDWLFLAQQKTKYKDDAVEFEGHAGFARQGSALDAKAESADAPLRLMVVDGRISAGGIVLSSAQSAALLYDGKQVIVRLPQGAPDPQIDLAQGMHGIKIKIVRQ